MLNSREATRSFARRRKKAMLSDMFSQAQKMMETVRGIAMTSKDSMLLLREILITIKGAVRYKEHYLVGRYTNLDKVLELMGDS